MSLNSTPSSERIHIGIFGKRNAGKSSLINAMTGQNSAVVSEVPGTTTDPVSKAMELQPLGPVVIIDTPGMDDIGNLGRLRVQKTYQVLNKADIALLIIDVDAGITKEDGMVLQRIREKKIPYLVVLNKIDSARCMYLSAQMEAYGLTDENCIRVSTRTGHNIYELKEKVAHLIPETKEKKKIISDLLQPGDVVVLVVPVDSGAPKGRLILPQQQTIRDIIDIGAVAVVVKDTQLEQTLDKMRGCPKLVITDSQIFRNVSSIVPEYIPLTSFSILFARYKGWLDVTVKGTEKLWSLKDGDKVLISEGCTHHRQCEDIGTVKIPSWIREFTGADVEFVFTSGQEFPTDLSKYAMIIHCGGCTLTDREMKYRLKCAQDQNVPITNYGMCIAYVNGILERSLQIFKKQGDEEW